MISTSLYFYLFDIKQEIERCGIEWNIYKKYTNPYEFIHTCIPLKRNCISRYNPLSRSYFKMVEMVHFFEIFTDKTNPIDTIPIKTFHLAEGPGGFIEAVATIRQNPQDVYIGMTLLDENDTSIPNWKKSEGFLQKYPNVFLEHGIDKTGNILSFNNFLYCNKTYGSSIDFITADGGFDFSSDFDNQEYNMIKLLYGQVMYALCMQKKGGSFILKVFDCFMQQTIDILTILSSFYEFVYITKPQTSRYANSEKYVVCKGFLHATSQDFYPYLYNSFYHTLNNKNTSPTRFLNIPTSHFFLSRMEEYNAIFGQQQIENIYSTITLIENKYKNFKIDTSMKNNIQKCIQWCIKYNVPFETGFG
jgi:23S rRNA U2552 (ribose-2'-O)-methylase RlmE/FtsJ